MNTTTEVADELTQPLDFEDPRQDDLELLEEFDRNNAKHAGAYSVEFIHKKVIIAGAYHKNITCILKLDSQTLIGFKSTVKAIAQSGSRGPLTLRSNIGTLEKALRDVPTKKFTPTTFQNLIKNKSNSVANILRLLFNIWYRLGYPGMTSETIDAVNSLKRPSSRPRARITSDDPTEGWYTSQEYDDLIDAYWMDYESGRVGLRDTTALLLNGQYGRRGIQLATLKVCDFHCEDETDGISGKRVSFPGAKDRQAEEWFRGSKFETHPMGDDLWDLCQLQIKDTISNHERFFQCELTPFERNQLPFFQKDPKKLVSLKNNRSQLFSDNSYSTSPLHLRPGGMAIILSNNKGTPVISQRTGQPVRQFAYRMRYTRARQLARLGVPRVTLQYWLGQEFENSLEHYYNDPAEDARLLNDEMQIILGPLAQAFSGSIRDKESDAIRGNDPSSRVELDGRHSVGSCGEHGFCSASVPIPCYRCSKFEPWVDAPHDEVLIRLIERQEEENNINLPSKARRMLVPLQLDKDIAAVKLVIKLCDARKQELNKQESNKQGNDELKEDLTNKRPGSPEQSSRKKHPVAERE
ncbi:hypothetical protein [Pseudomonas mandelii]|uniref:Integrase n=1 Tax=Pseudomonas mandelii TaxID=75612 RepID=A0A502HQN8_9PSED|nr:hypothetical protein [Pseudomonas mandelii]TPG77119.1 hypothetical protein EAH74_27735 [Pseudomonas mandelii]